MKEKFVKRLGLNKFFNEGSYQNLIGLYDTSIATMNVGDEIINDSIYNELSDLFSTKQFVRVPTHDGVSGVGIYRMNLAEKRFLCGSNIMTGKFFTSAQWNVGPIDLLRMKDMITVGVGWVDYQGSISKYTELAYKHILSSEYIHSVRDDYTKKKFVEMGVSNVVNTSCATMWKLTEEHCSRIPKKKANAVVFTITDYRRAKEEDEYLINTLCKNYKNVYFWVQGSMDFEYFRSLNISHDSIKVIPPQLSKYDSLLKQRDVDFVGTRLHAGIRSLQFMNRTIIIGVDNRAKEKSRDFNIKVIDRSDLKNSLEDVINSSWATDIVIPIENIKIWKEQF
ncbi:polysaccharide pyruvyl transferase family protein [Pseudoalteromonas sp. S4389]|uniref:polysaccharide pyruvyl transferase family protein n=1 Tax=Pseudoalteromonas sp. S4389 TaxID=579556 RepID=UPI001107BD98|nr:polysaccharide pyruvyl transferase family protein [Pseudoalteromonas sp. S4389]TMO40773.1 polysaccharide pyruvyl transferase family protein [Pseudoalteromonas sp. S4389]